MDSLVTTSSIILKASKQLKRLGVTIICLELIAIAWMVDSLFGKINWLNMSALEYGITFSSFLLAFSLLFLLYIFIKSLPQEDSDVVLFKQKRFEKPTLLRVLLTIQMVTVLYGAYSTDAWAQLYAINLFELQGFYDVFKLAAFLALHAIILGGSILFCKLAKLSYILNGSHSEENISKKTKKLRISNTLICAAFLVLIIWYATPHITVLLANLNHLNFGQLALYIPLVSIVLAFLLGYFILSIHLKKRFFTASHFYNWLTILLAIDLYITVGETVCSLRLFLESPVLFLPKLLYIILEALIVANLIRLSTYRVIASLFAFIITGTSSLQNAFADDILFTKAFERVDDENNFAAKAYFQFSLSSCDKQGDIHNYENKTFIGWILGNHFPPTVHDKNLLNHEEMGRLEKHEATPERIIAGNANNFGYIWLLGTTADARGKGYAKMLVEKTLQQMQKIGLEECWLSTENSGNLKFYQKNGFQLFAEQLSDLGITTYVMVSKLNKQIS